MKIEQSTRASLWIDLADRGWSFSRPTLVAGLLALTLSATASESESDARAINQVAGTWRMVSATLEADGRVERPYGDNPQGMLVFTPDMHFVEVLTDGDTPRFASDARGGGSDEENRRAMASSIGFFGTYSVDE